MASPVSFLYILCMILATVNSSVSSPREFTVGDKLGWKDPRGNSTDVYNQWAKNNRFQIGDTLLFKYKNDSVLQVDKQGYETCNKSHPITEFDNGNSTFTLDRSGPFYYISGKPNHCKHGQKMIVEVMSKHHHNHPRHLGPAASPSPLPFIASSPDQSVSGLAPPQQPNSAFTTSASRNILFGVLAAAMSYAYIY